MPPLATGCHPPCAALAPQVQYGYVNLEEIFRDSTHMSAGDLTALLTAKIVATSVCVGGGLVGGLFAPSLFLGALVGAGAGARSREPGRAGAGLSAVEQERPHGERAHAWSGKQAKQLLGVLYRCGNVKLGTQCLAAPTSWRC